MQYVTHQKVMHQNVKNIYLKKIKGHPNFWHNNEDLLKITLFVPFGIQGTIFFQNINQLTSTSIKTFGLKEYKKLPPAVSR